MRFEASSAQRHRAESAWEARYRGNPPRALALLRSPNHRRCGTVHNAAHLIISASPTLPPSSAILCRDTLKRLDGEKGIFSLLRRVRGNCGEVAVRRVVGAGCPA